jgi:WD40 repeat protein
MKERDALDGRFEQAYGLAFSPDSKTVVAATRPQTRNGVTSGGIVRIWNTATGRLQMELGNELARKDVAIDVAFSPDGRTLAVNAGVDLGTSLKYPRFPGDPGAFAEIELWDVGTWKRRAVLRGDPEGARQMAFTSDGKRLVTADKAGVRIWDVAAAKELKLFDKPGSDLNLFAISANGRHLAAAGFYKEGPVHVWDLDAILATMASPSK